MKSTPQQSMENWEEEYALFFGDSGAYFIKHSDLKAGIHNPISVKAFILKREQEVRAEVVEEIKDYVANALQLMGVTHGKSEMLGSWINVEDLLSHLTQQGEKEEVGG